MKKGKKRIIAVMLAFALIIGLMPNMSIMTKAEPNDGTTSGNEMETQEQQVQQENDAPALQNEIVEPNGDEPPATRFDYFIDGLWNGDDPATRQYPTSFRVRYSLDDGSTWINPFPADVVSNDHFFEFEDGGYCAADVTLDPNGYISASSNPANKWHFDMLAYWGFDIDTSSVDMATWDKKVKVEISIKDTPLVTGGATKQIMDSRLGNGNSQAGTLSDLSADASTPNTTWTYTYTDYTDAASGAHDMHLALSYPNSGRPEIVDEVNNYLYAYSGADDTALKASLAKELCARFIEVPMYEDFGIDNDATLSSRISFSGLTQIFAKNSSNADVTIDKYTATVSWGHDMNTGEEIISIFPVYKLSDAKDFLVCTDFNDSNGTGSTFYLRNADSDKKQFSQDSSDEGILILADGYENVVAGGNGGIQSSKNTDGMYSFDFCTMEQFNSVVGSPYNVCVRILKPSDAYVAIHGEGETKKTDGMGLNGYSYDTIWSTKEGSTATVFIGYTTLDIEPLNSIGVSTRTLKDISLKNANQKDGVTIDKSDLTKVKVTFKSNFYDSVPLKITYSDNTETELTVERIGLVIGYTYLKGDPNEDQGSTTDVMYYDCKSDRSNPSTGCSFSYNYFQGEQILIYATYYHPSNETTKSGGDDLYLDLKYTDGNHEIIHHTNSQRGFNGYLPATSDAVATTSFIIGFVPSKVFDGNVWTDDLTQTSFKNKFGNTCGFNATVINAGFNNDTTYGGTQVGSGKGVYWDGKINWY